MDPGPAILMRRIPLSETSVIAVWLTREHGVVRTAARGVRKAGSAFAGKLDLFHVADISIGRAKRGDLHSLREAELLETFPGLREDYRKVQLGAYFIELLEIALEPEHPEPELYELLLRALRYLNVDPADRRAMAHFERELVRALGLGDAAQAGLDQALALGMRRPALLAMQNAFHRLPRDHAQLWRDLA